MAGGSIILGLALGLQSAVHENVKPTTATEPDVVVQELYEEPVDPQASTDGDLSAVSAGFMEPCKLVCDSSHGGHLAYILKGRFWSSALI